MILAFDTATSFGAVCGVSTGARERAARAGDVLVAIDRLVGDPAAIEGIVVGRGPGSFTSIRIGLAVARALSLALDVQVAGVSTLDAFREGLPVIDARRSEVFTLVGGEPAVLAPAAVRGELCVGDGAVRYRDVLESNGAVVPPDDDERHLPRARFHAQLIGELRDVDEIEPLYLRAPDAKEQLP